jgi:hypothetical protein
VDVEAVVTGYLQAGSLGLRDETGATFASLSDRELVSEPGDRVRVRGTVRDGAFINGIAVETMERLDRGPAPAPRSVGPADLAAGAFYHDLVTASGVIRSVRQLGKSKTVVVLNVDGGTIEVRYEWLVSPEEAARLVDAEVTVTGFGAGETSPGRCRSRSRPTPIPSRSPPRRWNWSASGCKAAIAGRSSAWRQPAAAWVRACFSPPAIMACS